MFVRGDRSFDAIGFFFGYPNFWDKILLSCDWPGKFVGLNLNALGGQEINVVIQGSRNRIPGQGNSRMIRVSA